MACVVPALPYTHALHQPKPGMPAGPCNIYPTATLPVQSRVLTLHRTVTLHNVRCSPLVHFCSRAHHRFDYSHECGPHPSSTPSLSLLQVKCLESFQLPLIKLFPFTAPSCFPYNSQTSVGQVFS